MIALAAVLIAIAPIRVACVGDSITFGVGTSDPSTQSYPAQLQQLLGAAYQVRNFGHSGATLTRETDLPYWNVSEYKAALEFLPNIVVIKLGTNDATRQRWPRVKNAFVPEYKELIAAFRALETHPKVYICIPVPDYEERRENIDFAVVPLVKQIAREANTGLIDLYAPLEGKPELLPDRLHPNEEGARIVAETVAEAIEDPVERKKAWRVVSVDSQEMGEGPASNAIDGDTYTYWHTNYSERETRPPHEIVVDMGAEQLVSAFRYLPRQDGGVNGRVKEFEVYFSVDGQAWGAPVLKAQARNSASWTVVPLDKPLDARYFKFRAISEWHGGPWTSASELDVRRAFRK